MFSFLRRSDDAKKTVKMSELKSKNPLLPSEGIYSEAWKEKENEFDTGSAGPDKSKKKHIGDASDATGFFTKKAASISSQMKSNNSNGGGGATLYGSQVEFTNIHRNFQNADPEELREKFEPPHKRKVSAPEMDLAVKHLKRKIENRDVILSDQCYDFLKVVAGLTRRSLEKVLKNEGFHTKNRERSLRSDASLQYNVVSAPFGVPGPSPFHPTDESFEIQRVPEPLVDSKKIPIMEPEIGDDGILRIPNGYQIADILPTIVNPDEYTFDPSKPLQTLSKEMMIITEKENLRKLRESQVIRQENKIRENISSVYDWLEKAEAIGKMSIEPEIHAAIGVAFQLIRGRCPGLSKVISFMLLIESYDDDLRSLFAQLISGVVAKREFFHPTRSTYKDRDRVIGYDIDAIIASLSVFQYDQQKNIIYNKENRSYSAQYGNQYGGKGPVLPHYSRDLRNNNYTTSSKPIMSVYDL